MTVLLVLATFAIFLAIDYLYNLRRAERPVVAVAERELSRQRSSVAAGFQLPDHLHYHPGHTWALSESPLRMRIGLDDFAARLIGKIESIALPERGRWIRQGQKLLAVFRDGSKAELVSPLEGIVTDVNDNVARDPDLALRDPYGEGWLITVDSPDAKTNFRNLLSGALARRWMEEAAHRLQNRIPVLAGAVAQDGGLAVNDLTAHMVDVAWTDLTREFFLS